MLQSDVAVDETPIGAAPRRSLPEPCLGADAPIMEIMRTTRAMRHLSPQPVPAELLRAIIEAATWAPSGGNWQPANFVVVTDRARMAALASLWGRVIDDFRLLTASAGIASGADASHRATAGSIDYMRAHFAETPALIVICEDPRALGITRGSLSIMWALIRSGGLRRAFRMAAARPHFARSEGASYYPAAENLLLAARAHGLAACFTSWHLLAEEEFKRVIGIPRAIRTWAIIPVGYPLKRFGPVNRRPVEEVIHWDGW
jgi:nitroreductase